MRLKNIPLLKKEIFQSGKQSRGRSSLHFIKVNRLGTSGVMEDVYLYMTALQHTSLLKKTRESLLTVLLLTNYNLKCLNKILVKLFVFIPQTEPPSMLFRRLSCWSFKLWAWINHIAQVLINFYSIICAKDNCFLNKNDGGGDYRMWFLVV